MPTLLRSLVAALLLVLPLAASAQVNRAFTPRFSTNTNGDILLVGNTLVTCSVASGATGAAACPSVQAGAQAPNNNHTAAYVDVDGDASTFNSSSSTLAVPAGANVLWAGLYWSAERASIAQAPTPADRNLVRFKVPGGTYRTITAQQFDDGASYYAYAGYAEVTSLVQAAGNGSYTVGNLQVGVGGTNRFGGWSLIVVYELASEPLRNLTVTDGNALVAGSNKVTISPYGFTTPFSGSFSPRVGVVVTDGDSGSGTYTGDSLKVNGVAMSDALNPANNFFNSTISNFGAQVTSRTPAYLNTLGYDIDRIAVPNGVVPNGATSATLKLTTGGESYAVHAVTFATEIYRPFVVTDKTVYDLNGGQVKAGDVLEYAVTVRNTGADNAVGMVLTDPIPAYSTYVPGSLVVGTGANVGPKTDASGDDVAEYVAGTNQVVFRLGAGASTSLGGTLAQNATTSAVFRVRVNAGVPDGTTLFNRAVVDYAEQTLGGRRVSTGDVASTTVGIGTDLVVLKTDSADPVRSGETFFYTVTYRNDGPDAATDVLIRDALPSGLRFVSATAPSGWTQTAPAVGSSGNVVFQKAASAAGEVASFRITATVDPGAAAGSVTNTVAVSSATPDVNASNNEASQTTQIETPADLRVTKQASSAAVNVGSTVTFTVGVQNTGPAIATGVRVRDELPSGLTLVSATPSQGTFAAGVWTVGSLPVNGSATLTVVATVTGPGPYANTAEVIASDQPDPDSSPANANAAEDDQATATVTGIQADLSLSKSVSDTSPLVGSDVQYTLTLANAGPSGATGVSVRDAMPPGLTLVSAAPSQGTFDQNTGLWTVGAVPAGSTATITLVARVTGAGPYTNIAQVASSDQPDPDSSPGNSDPNEDDQASATVGGVQVDLSLQKTVTAGTVRRGALTTFTLTVRNDGTTGATGVVVRDQLPAGLTFVSAAPSQGSYTAGTGLWAVGALAIGQAASLDLVVRADAEGALVNGAEVIGSDQPDADSSPNNGVASEDDQATASVNATPLIDLRLSKTVSDPMPDAGTDVTFTLTVANDGPSDATGVSVRDVMPAGLTFVSATPAQGTFDANTGIWTLGPVPSGAARTLTVVATVPGTGPYTNQAEIYAADQDDADSIPGNSDPTEDDQASATVGGRVADLSLQKLVAPDAVAVGATTTFTLVVRNEGSASATHVEVTDALPAGLTFVSAATAQGTYASGTGVWAVGTLAPGASASLDLVVRVTAGGALRNVAEVTRQSTLDLDSTPGNGDGTEDDLASVVVTGLQADLSLSKTVSNAAPTVNSEVTFTVTLRNGGPADAPGVAVTDALPSGFAFVNATTSQGAYDSATGVWMLGTVPANVVAVLTVRARVLASGVYTNVAQVTASGLPDPDSTPNNNAGQEDDYDYASASPLPSTSDLRLDKRVNNPAPRTGDAVTFTVVVYNDGPSTATGVRVTDLLPAGLVLNVATPSQGTYALATGLWDVGSIAVNDSARLQVVVRVTGTAPISNVAEVVAADQGDPDSMPGNHLGAEDDQDEATVSPMGSSGGGGAGVESDGAMALLLARRLYDRREDFAARAVLLEPAPVVPFQAAGPAVRLDPAPLTGAAGTTEGLAGVLRNVIPARGPENLPALETTPTDLLGVTNATEVVAADYARVGGVRLGAIFGATSRGGILYDHTKNTCDRLGGGRLESVRSISVRGQPFVLSKLVHASGLVDYAASFVAYRQGTRFTVESRFASQQYVAPAGTEEVLNLQVWSVSPEYTAALVAEVLNRLGTQGTVAFSPAPAVVLPQAFVVDGRYEGRTIVLRLQNTTAQPQPLTVRGLLSATEAAATSGQRTVYEQTFTLPVPTAQAPLAEVRLPVGPLFDGVFRFSGASTLDEVYVADGAWSYAAGTGSQVRTFEVTADARTPQPGSLHVERSVRAEGTVGSFASVFRYLRPSGLPVDLAAYQALTFTYRSSTPVQVLVEKASVGSWGGKFVAELPASPAGATVQVPFTSLAAAGGEAGRFTANDVTMVAFYPVNLSGTPRAFALSLSDLRFTGLSGTTPEVPSGAIMEVTLPPSAPNPVRSRAQVRFALPTTLDARLDVLDLLGRQVATLVDGSLPAGWHAAYLDTTGWPTGTYVTRLTTKDGVRTQTLVVVR